MTLGATHDPVYPFTASLEAVVLEVEEAQDG